MVKNGSWVEVKNIVLKAEQRASNLPKDTKEKDLVMWVRGFLTSGDAQTGDTVTIKTLADRTVDGVLFKKNPRHEHDYGDTIVELIQIGEELKSELSNALAEESE